MRSDFVSAVFNAVFGKPGHAPAGSPQGGAILLGLVVGMVTLSAVGAAVISATNVSTFNQVNANHAVKAYYLAESGYRFAGSQYVNATTDAERDLALINLHDRTFTLREPDGGFHLRVYPRFYRTTAASTGATVQTIIPGGLAEAAHIPTTGILRFGNVFREYSSRAITIPSAGAPVTVVFTLTSAVTVAAGAIVRNVARSIPSVQSVGREGNLNIRAAEAAAFPLHNGSFMVGTDNVAYVYRTREPAGADWRLTGIRRLHDPDADFTLPVPAGSNITLLKFLGVESRGMVGAGMTTSARTITYSGPIAATAEDQGGVAALETVSSPAALVVAAAATGGGAMGGFQAVTLAGNEVLHINQTTGGSGAGNQPSVEAYVMQPEGEQNPLLLSWRGAGNFLSYDIQVKVATGTWDNATSSFINKPDTYCAGVIFRATERSNQSTFYGLSFMSAGLGRGKGTDGIQNTMNPPGQADRSMVVLWTRNGNAGNGDNHWLAYRLLDETTGSDFVVDTAGRLRDWSSLLVRVVEAASVKLTVNDAPEIRPGQTISGAVGAARVYRLIHDHDGRVVILLNNVEGGFTRPAMIGTRATDTTWGFRPRDNYIWAMFADTANRPVHDAEPANNTRQGRPLGKLDWPVTDIQGWSAQEDRFTLVRWDAALNLSSDGDPTLRRMGAGRELNAIIRTNRWTTGRTIYTTNFPPEIGLVSLGRTSVQTHFGDLAFHLRGADDRVAHAGLQPPVVQ